MAKIGALFALFVFAFHWEINAQILSRDTVFTSNMAGIEVSKKEMKIFNASDTAVYLDKIQMVIAKEDTFQNYAGGAAVIFNYNYDGPGLCYGKFSLSYSKYNSNSDTSLNVTSCAGTTIGKKDTITLSTFRMNPCFCLVKESTQIGYKDTIAIKIRLAFSKKNEEDKPYSKYFTIKGIFEPSSGIMDSNKAIQSKGNCFTRLMEEGFGLNGQKLSK